MQQGRKALTEARAVAVEQERILLQRRRQLWRLEHETARLRATAAQKRAEQETALNAALDAKGRCHAGRAGQRGRVPPGDVTGQPAGCRARGARGGAAPGGARGGARRGAIQAAVGRRLPLAGGWSAITWWDRPTSPSSRHTPTRSTTRISMASTCDTRWLRGADPGVQGRRGGGVRPAVVAVRPGLRRGDRPRRWHPDLVLAHHHPDHRAAGPGGRHRAGDRLRGHHGLLDRLPPALRDQHQRDLGEPALPAAPDSARGPRPEQAIEADRTAGR